MKRSLIVIAALLCAAAFTFAQDTNQPATGAMQQPQPGITSIRGCLTAGGDRFKLTTDIGARVLDLSIDKQAATPFIAHEVEIQGLPGSENTFRVDRILDIADHCGHSGETPVTDVNSVIPKPR